MSELSDNALEKVNIFQMTPGQELATRIAKQVCNQLGLPEHDSFKLVFNIVANLMEKYEVV